MIIDFTHHAYCLEGDLLVSKDILFKELEAIGIKTTGNPNLLSQNFKKLGIDESKNIINFQTRKAFGGEKKIIVLEIENITREAQNSLLKTLEEPTPDTHFFLILRSKEILLPTLRSRLEFKRILKDVDFDESEKFINSPHKKRLELVKEIIEEKDRTRAINLLNGIEKYFYNKKNLKKAKNELGGFLKTLIKFRGFLNERSPSIKQILEHLSLITPKN